MESAEKTTVLPQMYSYFNSDLNLSIEAPGGWVAGKNDDFLLLLIAPIEQSYRTNLGFNVRALEISSQAEVERVIQATQRNQEQELAGYRLNRAATLIVDNRPIFIRFYEWKDPESGLHFSQLQAVAMVAEGLVFTIDGSTTREMEDQYLPVLEYMVRSIRFIETATPAPGQEQATD